MKKYLLIIIFLPLSSLFSEEYYQQFYEDFLYKRLQLDFNLGTSNIGASLSAVCHYQISGNHFISARDIYSGDLDLIFPSVFSDMREISLLYTYRFEERLLLSTGIGYSWGKIKENFDEEPLFFDTPSLPFNIYFNYLTDPPFKLGITWFTILNDKMSIWGISLSFSLAKD